MTCIVGVEHNNKVYIGGDSMAAAGWDSHTIDFKKVFRNGEFLIGYSNSFRMGQLLQHSLSIPKQNNIDDYSYIITCVVPTVQELFIDNRFGKLSDNRVEGGDFLLGYRGKLYKIDSDFQVMRYKSGVYALGCGYAYALGSVITNKSDDVKERILTALSVSAEFSNGVCPPFYVEEL